MSQAATEQYPDIPEHIQDCQECTTDVEWNRNDETHHLKSSS